MIKKNVQKPSTAILRKTVMYMGLCLLVLLIGLSIYGSFIGPEKAGVFFTSLPLSVFWLILTLILTAGLWFFPTLQRQPGSLAMHSGCILVLIGAMFGSEPGHNLYNEFLQKNRIPRGGMVIHEGESSNVLRDENLRREVRQLPFRLHLNDFAIDYYWDKGQLYILTPEQQHYSLPAKPGTKLDIPEEHTTLEVIAVLKNFKIVNQEGQMAFVDEAGGVNPAVRIKIDKEGQEPEIRTVFMLFPEFGNRENGLKMHYVLMPSEYISDLEVIEDGKTVKKHRLEVNKPLHHNGYYFYQSSYDDQEFAYTILSVTSDLGYPLVFAGYALICLGAIGHFWFGKLKIKNEG